MIELLYVWIESYKNIHRQGFNLSSEYQFSFQLEELTLRIEKRQGHVPRLFPKNILNVTAITGENGSGKSNALHYLRELFTSSLYQKLDQLLVAIKVNNELQIHCYQEFADELQLEGTLAQEVLVYPFHKEAMQTLLRYNLPLALNDQMPQEQIPSIIYYSADFEDAENVKTDIPFSDALDISTSHLFQADLDESIQTEGESIHEAVYPTSHLPKLVKETHFHREMRRQLAFVCRKENVDNESEFSFIPKRLTVRPKLYHVVEAFSLDRESSDREFSMPRLDYMAAPVHYPELLHYFDTSQNERIQDKDKLRNGLVTRLFLNFFHDAVTTGKLDSHQEEAFRETLETFIESNFGVQEESDVLQTLTQLKLATNQEIEQGYELLTSLLENVNDISDSGNFEIEVGQNSKELLEGLLYLMNYSPVWQIVDFSWYQLSSGERRLLNLFSRLYDLFRKGNLSQNLLIFIEEADSEFHPHWQKAYLSQLLDYLPKIFPSRKMQLILTTNSPFVISDLPRNHIVFMQRNHEGYALVKDGGALGMPATFGAKPTDLLTHAFFLKDSHIGAFAQKKIEELIHFLQGEASELDPYTAQQLIYSLGNPVLQRQLQDMFDTRKTNDMWAKIQQVHKLAQEKLMPPSEELAHLKKKIVALEQELKSLGQSTYD